MILRPTTDHENPFTNLFIRFREKKEYTVSYAETPLPAIFADSWLQVSSFKIIVIMTINVFTKVR